jgi:hypothetical protein
MVVAAEASRGYNAELEKDTLALVINSQRRRAIYVGWTNRSQLPSFNDLHQTLAPG